MPGAVFRCFFLGYSTTFRQNRQPFPGKPGSTAATNTAGKNGHLRGRIRRNGTVGARRGAAKKKQKLPHKKQCGSFLLLRQVVARVMERHLRKINRISKIFLQNLRLAIKTA